MSAPLVRRLSLPAAALALTLVSACSSVTLSTPTGGSSRSAGSPSATASTASITSNITRGASNVDLGRTLRLTVARGTFKDVTVTGPGGSALAGAMSADKTHWTSSGRLVASATYHVVGTAQDDSGQATSYDASFATRKLTLDEQTFPSIQPLDGQTVGVGMPVMIRFDRPVTNHAAFERHLHVISQPAQPGSFHWISDNEVHWRPQSYWQAGTTVTVKADIGGLPAGNGIFGQLNRQISFTVGRSMISRVNINTHQLKVFRDGVLIRTIPVTTGQQPKFTTRSGIKVIVEKKRRTRMNSETIGIDPKSADGYDLNNVEYAMRLTYSGEFLHAAPWSVAYQGHDNVSHGCTGMSTANAQWLYNQSIVGDVVEYTGSSKMMTLTNGYGDWNESFAQYQAGSALGG